MKHCEHQKLLAGIITILLGWTTNAFAQNTIQSISGQIIAGVETITIKTIAPISKEISHFSTATPPRIALDFPEISSGTIQNRINSNIPSVQNINLVQSNNKTRLIVNLKQSTPYKIIQQDNFIDIVLQNNDSIEQRILNSISLDSSKSSSSYSSSTSTATHQIRNIDFRKGTNNTGRLIIDLDQTQSNIDVSFKGKTLMITLPKYQLPDVLRRRLDVSDFGTIVQTILSEPIIDGTKIVVTPTGNWEYNTFQTESQFVVEFREQMQDSKKLPKEKLFSGEKLSLNFQNIDLRTLLQVIADFTNFNIIASDSVIGSVTLRLKDVPWDQALEIILQSKNLGMKKNGNVIWIAPLDEIAARDKMESDARISTEAIEALKTQSFQLNYAKSSEVASYITSNTSLAVNSHASNGNQNRIEPNGRILSPRGSVIAEPRTNQLFVTDTPSRLDAVQLFINKLDISVRQVLIEARIVEANDKFGQSLGVKLGGADLRGIRGGDAGYSVGGNNRLAIGGNYDAINATTSAFSSSALTSATTNFLNLPASGLGGVSPASFALSLFSPSANRFLSMELSALEADSRGKIVSNPRLLTADKVKAIIEQGVEFPYQTTAPNGGTTIVFKKASLKLEVTPQITPEGAVILEVEINKDSPGEILLGARAINTKRVQTQVLVENGGTVVIGGIFESTETNAENKVPLLGDIPIFGNIFKNKSKEENKSELLIFITPKVVENSASRL